MPGIAPPKSRRLAPPASIGACADVGVPDANLYGRAAHPGPPGVPRIAPRNRGSDTDTSPTSSVCSPPASAGVSETLGRSCILDTSVPSRLRSAPPRQSVSHQPRTSILTGILAHPTTKGHISQPVDFRQLLPPVSVVSFDTWSQFRKDEYPCQNGGRTRPCGVDRHTLSNA